MPAPGLLLDHGPALSEAVGRIYWAGTETAAEWTGYMEGAVASGQRAAREVLSNLATSSRPEQARLYATGTGG